MLLIKVDLQKFSAVWLLSLLYFVNIHMLLAVWLLPTCSRTSYKCYQTKHVAVTQENHIMFNRFPIPITKVSTKTCRLILNRYHTYTRYEVQK